MLAKAGLVGRDGGSGIKDSTFPLCYIFNKAEHAGTYSPFNHVSFLNGPFTPAEFTLWFCTFLTHYWKYQLQYRSDVWPLRCLPFFSSPMFWEKACMLGIYRQVWIPHWETPWLVLMLCGGDTDESVLWVKGWSLGKTLWKVHKNV